jgi:hypothetical protein
LTKKLAHKECHHLQNVTNVSKEEGHVWASTPIRISQSVFWSSKVEKSLKEVKDMDTSLQNVENMVAKERYLC